MSCIQTASKGPLGAHAGGHAREHSAHPLDSLWHRIGAWIERRRQRNALAELDRRLLDDIGVAPDAAAREAAKPFWRG